MKHSLFPDIEPTLPGYPCAFSADRRYRYVLWRVWENHGAPRYCAFVGLNPSTADESTDDPTIRRCVGFAKAWQFDALAMLNLFAFRATDPQDMRAADDPVGDDNDSWLAKIAGGASIVVAAWGAHGSHLNRASIVRASIPNLHCLRLTKNGHPAHPLYLPGSLAPVEWIAASTNQENQRDIQPRRAKEAHRAS